MKNFCKWVIIIFLVIALIYLYNLKKVEGFGPADGVVLSNSPEYIILNVSNLSLEPHSPMAGQTYYIFRPSNETFTIKMTPISESHPDVRNTWNNIWGNWLSRSSIPGISVDAPPEGNIYKTVFTRDSRIPFFMIYLNNKILLVNDNSKSDILQLNLSNDVLDRITIYKNENVRGEINYIIRERTAAEVNISMPNVSIYSWKADDCPTACGNEQSEQTRKCVDQDGNTADADSCPDEQSEATNTCAETAACTYSWHAPEFPDCPTACGTVESTQTRTVTCVDQDGQTAADASSCIEAEPEATNTCAATPPCCTMPTPPVVGFTFNEDAQIDEEDTITGITCADGYSGNPIATCSNPGDSYELSGCVEKLTKSLSEIEEGATSITDFHPIELLPLDVNFDDENLSKLDLTKGYLTNEDNNFYRNNQDDNKYIITIASDNNKNYYIDNTKVYRIIDRINIESNTHDSEHSASGVESNSCSKPTNISSSLPDTLLSSLPNNMDKDESYRIACPDGYTGNLTLTCNNVDNPYTITDTCNHIDDGNSCVKPSEKTGYSFELNRFGIYGILNRDRFNVVGIECAEDYQGEAKAVVCDAPGEEYKLTGCSPLCKDPEDTTGYDLSNASGSKTLPDFTLKNIKCADTHNGTAFAVACTQAGEEYKLIGCDKNKECICENGVPDQGCRDEKTVRCKSCNENYELTDSKTCEPSCICVDEFNKVVGEPDKDCSEVLENKCKSCKPGYTLNGSNECIRLNCKMNFDEEECTKIDKDFFHDYDYLGDINALCDGEKCSDTDCCKRITDWNTIIELGVALFILLIVGYVVYNEYFKGPSISSIDIN